ncbi:MAG: diguanylate cyclase [Candidatus Dormibacteria bacterium]
MAQLRELLGLARQLGRPGDERALAGLVAGAAVEQLRLTRCVVAFRGDDGAFHVQAGATERDAGHDAVTISAASYRALRDASGGGVGLHQLPAAHPVLTRPDLARWLSPDGGPPGRSGRSRSVCFVPLIGPRNEHLGLLVPRRPTGSGRLKAAEVLLLESLGELAVVGLEIARVRDLERSAAAVARAQRNQLERLLDASTHLRGRLAVEEVLAEIARAMSTAGGFGGVVIYLVEPSTDQLRVVATSGLGPEDDRRLRSEPVRLSEFSPLMLPEMRLSRSFLFDHRRFQMPPGLLQKLSVPQPSQTRPGWQWHPLDSLTVPLLDPSGATLGLISMDEPYDGKFPDRAHVRALEFFADQCALAVVQSRRYEAAHAEALTDELTGLANRRALALAAGRMVARARRRGDGFAVLFIDIDHFKHVNDRLGHSAGDEVLRKVADAIRWRLRQVDMLARYGGEEFVALVSGADAAAAAGLAEELRRLVAELDPDTVAGGMPLRVSIGVAVLGPEHTTPEALLAAADHAMYAAKRAGRDRVALAWE